jgi:hydrogenase maturation factor
VLYNNWIIGGKNGPSPIDFKKESLNSIIKEIGAQNITAWFNEHLREDQRHHIRYLADVISEMNAEYLMADNEYEARLAQAIEGTAYIVVTPASISSATSVVTPNPAQFSTPIRSFSLISISSDDVSVNGSEPENKYKRALMNLKKKSAEVMAAMESRHREELNAALTSSLREQTKHLASKLYTQRNANAVEVSKVMKDKKMQRKTRFQ